LPHAPQLLGSVFVVTHDEPQSVCPETHSVEHTLLTHAMPLGQAWPQAPQLALSEVVLVQVLVSAPIGWPMAESVWYGRVAESTEPESGALVSPPLDAALLHPTRASTNAQRRRPMARTEHGRAGMNWCTAFAYVIFLA
jgi:hypothetical protein